jgi:hypothetical protein
MVRVGRFAEVLEIDERVFLHALVEGAEVGRAEAEWVGADEVMEVPVDELPIETVVVGNEQHAAFAIRLEPLVKALHDRLGIVEPETLLSREIADGQGLRDKRVGNWFELALESAFESRFHNDRPEGDHRVIARNGAVRFDVDHDVGHSVCFLNRK